MLAVVHVRTASALQVSYLSNPWSPPWKFLQIYQVQVQILLVHVRSLIRLIHQLFHFHQFPNVQVPLPVASCCVLPVSPGTDGRPRIIRNLCGSCQGLWRLLDCQKEYTSRCSYLCSPFLYSPLCKPMAYISAWNTMVWSPVLKVCPSSRPSIHPSASAFIGLWPVRITDVFPFVVWVEPVLPFTLVRKPDCEWLVKCVSQRHPDRPPL